MKMNKMQIFLLIKLRNLKKKINKENKIRVATSKNLNKLNKKQQEAMRLII